MLVCLQNFFVNLTVIWNLETQGVFAVQNDTIMQKSDVYSKQHFIKTTL